MKSYVLSSFWTEAKFHWVLFLIEETLIAKVWPFVETAQSCVFFLFFMGWNEIYQNILRSEIQHFIEKRKTIGECSACIFLLITATKNNDQLSFFLNFFFIDKYWFNYPLHIVRTVYHWKKPFASFCRFPAQVLPRVYDKRNL